MQQPNLVKRCKTVMIFLIYSTNVCNLAYNHCPTPHSYKICISFTWSCSKHNWPHIETSSYHHGNRVWSTEVYSLTLSLQIAQLPPWKIETSVLSVQHTYCKTHRDLLGRYHLNFSCFSQFRNVTFWRSCPWQAINAWYSCKISLQLVFRVGRSGELIWKIPSLLILPDFFRHNLISIFYFFKETLVPGTLAREKQSYAKK